MFHLNKLYVVGIGPGAPEELTLRARKALEAAQDAIESDLF